MLGLIGDYCGKIQLNLDKVRQSYIIKTKWGLTLQRVEVLTFRYRQHVNIADINMLSIAKLTLQRVEVLINILIPFFVLIM